MLTLDKKLFSAIDVLISISFKPSVSPVCSKNISEETGIGLRVVEQILQALVKAKILKGVRGATGGYLLAKERRKINLQEVLNAIKTLKHNGSSNAPYSKGSHNAIIDLQQNLSEAVNELLLNITLDDLYNKALNYKNETGSKMKSDFVI